MYRRLLLCCMLITCKTQHGELVSVCSGEECGSGVSGLGRPSWSRRCASLKQSSRHVLESPPSASGRSTPVTEPPPPAPVPRRSNWEVIEHYSDSGTPKSRRPSLMVRMPMLLHSVERTCSMCNGKHFMLQM